VSFGKTQIAERLETIKHIITLINDVLECLRDYQIVIRKNIGFESNSVI